MKCKVDIKKALIKKAINISDSQYVKLNRENTLFISQQQIFPSGYTAEKYANVVVDALNKNFGGDIASIRTNIKVDGFEIELNPSEDLVNKYYDGYLSSALGAKPADVILESKDRVVFGHPAIGKSFLKDKKDNRFISLDDDYSAEIKTNVENIANTYNVTTYQVKDGGNQKWNKEYDAMMQNLFDVARKRAISENKTLFTSNTNLLKNNINSFDKVINISDEEFFKRIKQRQEKGGAKYDIKEWKSQINNAISKVPASKVINTDKFLSDLLQEPSNLNNAKTLLEKVEPINNEKLFSDLANLIFTEDVIRYLHKENMSRLSLETYAKEVQILADNLIGLGYTKEEVLTTIKCL
jgi:hypothetical protein